MMHARSIRSWIVVASTILLAVLVLPIPSSATVPAEGDRMAAVTVLDALETTYESGATDEFIALLTPDYRFFSPDEGMRRRFPQGFTREDERNSHARLFAGGMNSEGRMLPRALAVDVEFLDSSVCPDPEHPGDAGHAVIHVRRACLTIRFADGSGMHDAAPHAFWMVRTDEGWRCRRWVERPVTQEPLLATADTEPARPARPSLPIGALAGAAGLAGTAVLGATRRRP